MESIFSLSNKYVVLRINKHKLEINIITQKIIGASIEIHKSLGPGLLESSYKECLAYRLRKYESLFVEKEKPIPLIYEEVKLDIGYRADLVVEKIVIVEIKSVECLNDIHTSQLITYLKLGEFPIGLLINFNVVLLKHGIKRLVN